MTIHIVEVSRITPAPNSDSVLNSSNLLTIPLTFFDLPWLVFKPAKRVFFYRLIESTREQFHSFILPKLKLSLSLVLRDYLPLCDRITWDPNEPKPSIVVSKNDAVLVSIAESDADFSIFSGYGQRPASEIHNSLPEVPVSDDSASALSLQITLFPGQGFSIGVAAHHGVSDGKTSTMFIKAWAHLLSNLIRVTTYELEGGYRRSRRSTTYFGNCMFPAGSYNRKTAKEFAGEGGFVTAVEILSGLVKGFGSRKIETIDEEFKIGNDCAVVSSQFGAVAGSTQLGVYESDFWWGRPVKVDVVSIERERISMAERRDETGGIEIGMCMEKAELDIVHALFNNGLQN
ncbi:hypothetical protein Bca101_099889 [Brassica carinata]